METLSSNLGLGYFGLCKVPRTLVDVILSVGCHADVCIPFIRLCVSSGRPTRVSPSYEVTCLHVSNGEILPALHSGIATRSQ